MGDARQGFAGVVDETADSPLKQGTSKSLSKGLAFAGQGVFLDRGIDAGVYRHLPRFGKCRKRFPDCRRFETGNMDIDKMGVQATGTLRLAGQTAFCPMLVCVGDLRFKIRFQSREPFKGFLLAEEFHGVRRNPVATARGSDTESLRLLLIRVIQS